LGGVIKDLGFYKVLGLLYTLARTAGADPLLVALGLVNLGSFALVGLALMRLLLRVSHGSPMNIGVWTLWAAFMANPFLVDLITVLRKDLLIVAVFLVGVEALVAGKWRLLAVSAAVLGTLTLEQGALLGVGAFVMWACRFNKWAGVFRRSRMARLLVLGLPFLPGPIVGGILGGLFRRCCKHIGVIWGTSLGLRSLLQGSMWGAAAYAWNYPFPRVTPGSVEEFIRSGFALVWFALTTASLTKVLAGFGRGRTGWSQNGARNALEWMFLAAFAGLCLLTIATSAVLGFVVIEARYKLPLWVLAAVLLRMDSRKRPAG
jgi:hypothetical protein